jgi:hypothetical protein
MSKVDAKAAVAALRTASAGFIGKIQRQRRQWYRSCSIVIMRFPCALAAGLILSACGSEPTPTDNASAGAASQAGAGGQGGQGGQEGHVELGVPGGSDGLSFTPLEAGSEVRLETFGQGATHISLGIRCIGFGARAFVAITLQNLVTNAEVVAPAPARAQLLFCEGEVCDLVPLTVVTAGLTRPDEERDGLAISISADVHNAAGVHGEASTAAVLSTMDL